jgi:hypothetical protein
MNYSNPIGYSTNFKHCLYFTLNKTYTAKVMLNFYFPMDGLFEAGRLEGTWVLALAAEGREDAGRREGNEDTRGEDTGREDAGRREGREDTRGGTQKPLQGSTMLVGPIGLVVS